MTDFVYEPNPIYRVLLSIELNEPQPAVEDYIGYIITNIPPGSLSAQVEVHSAFDDPPIILLTLPLEVWTMLPENLPTGLSHTSDGSFFLLPHHKRYNFLPRLEAELAQDMETEQRGPSSLIESLSSHPCLLTRISIAQRKSSR
jgi:hypothetical protein